MKLFYVILGCIGLGLGAVGAAVPLLPAFPFCRKPPLTPISVIWIGLPSAAKAFSSKSTATKSLPGKYS